MMPRARVRRLGFTLIEMLAVIVIVSMIAAVTVAHVAAASDAARLAAATSAVRDIDARGRMFARGGTACLLTPAVDRNELTLRSLDGTGVLASEVLPPGVTVYFDAALSGSGGAGGVVYDLLGRSADYECTLVHQGGAERWSVTGLTGQITSRESDR